MAYRLDHPLYLMFPSLVDGHLEPGIAFPLTDLIHFCRCREAIFQFDASFERLDLGIVKHTLHLDQIGFGDMVAWMEQRLGQVPMIRQQHESFTVEIQPSDRKHPHRDSMQQILHGRTTFRIVERGHDIFGLVEDEIDIGLRRPQMLAIDLDVVAAGVDLGTKLLHHVAVDGHASGRNQFLGLAPRGQSGTGDQFLETNFHPTLS